MKRKRREQEEDESCQSGKEDCNSSQSTMAAEVEEPVTQPSSEPFLQRGEISSSQAPTQPQPASDVTVRCAFIQEWLSRREPSMAGLAQFGAEDFVLCHEVHICDSTRGRFCNDGVVQADQIPVHP